MIKIENTEVFGWEAAIRGMRNPLNSHKNSDSNMSIQAIVEYWDYFGEKDLKLMKSLISAGDDHGKVARFLDIYVDITAPLYFWKEFRTYRKGKKFMDDGDEFTDPDELEMHIETNSCSTMHKIAEKEFTLEDFSREHLSYENTLVLQDTINALNEAREGFIETKDKEYWWQMIQLLPSSYNQKRTVKLNYQVLKNIYHARRAHKLDEWHVFCDWVETLPYSELITGDKK